MADSLCLECETCRVIWRRGCCYRCYRRLGHLVASGKATWAELEAAGRCLPRKPRGSANGGHPWSRDEAARLRELRARGDR